MDRREALKKLGAGSAIVIASPVILPSFKVAHAASHQTTEPPDPNDPEVIIVDESPGGSAFGYDLTISPDAVDCGGGAPATSMTVSWQIQQLGGWDLGALQVLDANTESIIVSAEPGTTPSASVPGSNSVIIRRAQAGGLTLLVTFTVVATVAWYCDAEPLVATYAFQKSGLFGSDLTITLG